MIEKKSEVAFLDQIRMLVDGNHATADKVTVVKEVKLSHLSEWRFYADTSSVNMDVGKKSLSGPVSVNAKEFESQRDRFIREFSN